MSAGWSAISYIVYGPLLHGCTSVLYEGKPVGTPDAGAYWRCIAEHGVVAMFTAPTAFRAIKKEDPAAKLVAGRDLARFRTLFLAGERADPDTVKWAEIVLKIPVIDHWWQTETGWAIAGNPVGLERLPVKPGSPTVAMPGYEVRVVDEAGREVARRRMGSIVVRLPLPPGSMPSFGSKMSACGRAISPSSQALQNGRRRLHGRGRLPLCDGTHRRHHQCRRPSSVDGRHGRGARGASRRRRMRRHRNYRRDQGRGALWVPGAQGRRRARSRRDRVGVVAMVRERSAQSPLSGLPSRCHGCRRPGQEKSCAAP